MKEIALKLEDKLHRDFKTWCAREGFTMQGWLTHEVKVIVKGKPIVADDVKRA